LPKPDFDEVWMTQKAGTLAALITNANEPYLPVEVNGKLEHDENSCEERHEVGAAVRVQGLGFREEGGALPVDERRALGMVTLPQLGARQSGHQRAFLKVQDGCDAHCTYCIIPQLRPRLWSKPVEEAVEEARQLVEAGHGEIVLTGIFLGAYGQPTALRRRQAIATAKPLGELVQALCTRVPRLERLRLSSLEPGDLTEELIDVLKGHRQVVPHFHLPLQSGSNLLLRRMNRQYGRDDFLRMAEQVKGAFDRPAMTTDIIVGFPGETAEEFERTVEVVQNVGFIHIHAFSYSPRPKTAAARWTREAVCGPVVNERINRLGELSVAYSLKFRRQFIGEVVEVLVERASGDEGEMQVLSGYQHGRCERYFSVHFESHELLPGAKARVRIDRVTATRTFGTLMEGGR
jgi:threonylcarbamoyladenosine tRNA methylthiotransferase MtaB